MWTYNITSRTKKTTPADPLRLSPITHLPYQDAVVVEVVTEFTNGTLSVTYTCDVSAEAYIPYDLTIKKLLDQQCDFYAREEQNIANMAAQVKAVDEYIATLN